MKRATILKKMRLNALGSSICSVGITLVQVLFLYITGALIIYDINAHVVGIIITLYLGSFLGLFAILHFTSTR
jgi:hypothetical protein